VIKKGNAILFYVLTLLFVALDTWFILKKQSGIVAALPLVLMIVYLAVFALDKLILFVVFCTPLSISLGNLHDAFLEQVQFDAAFPTEPIMFGILLLFIFLLLYDGIDKHIINHPVSYIIMAMIFWMIVTTFTSTMPIISVKYCLERSWGIVTFYFLGVYLFSKKKNIYSFLWLYIISFTIIITYTTIRHARFHFTEKGAHNVMNPFYNDHTAYGALLAMFIPVIIGLVVNNYRGKYSRIAAFVLLLVYITAVGLSFSRAAWVSLVVAAGVFVVLMLRIKLRTIFIVLCVGVIALVANQKKLVMKLEKNNKEVSQDISSEIESISNISSDASNRERLNRWSCAYRMFLDKPVFGFGPGTYSFQYGPYQLWYEKTIISTNLGRGGNAHSEYLGPLSEQGLFGMLTFLSLVIAVFILSFKLYYRLRDRERKIIVASLFLGLMTYFVHGMMNDFLDSDKAAVPFWGFIAILVAFDLESRGIKIWKSKTLTSISGSSAE
jgi:O-antigen ligase